MKTGRGSIFRIAVAGLVALTIAGALASGCTSTTSEVERLRPRTVNEALFAGQLNRLPGVGGEILVNRVLSEDDPSTPGRDPDGEMGDPDGDGPIPPHVIQRLDIGDRLVGIGTTLAIHCTQCEPGQGPRELGTASDQAKHAARAFVVAGKERVPRGFRFRFSPLSPEEYSATLREASGGAIVIPPESIPRGTMVLSFDDAEPSFSLSREAGSPASNWRGATDGIRHWNVGVAKETDFWMSTFPTDDLALVELMAPEQRIESSIRFGLSLLPGGLGEELKLTPVECEGPDGVVKVDFCLTGSVVGTAGIETPFPIGLDTEVRLHLQERSR